MQIFNLKSDEHLSDYKDRIPKAAGQYLIIAETGVGKTYQQVRMAQKAGVYTIFPVKSIVQQQREEAKKDNLKIDNIIQLEHFLTLNDTHIKAVILDECQWLYEGGFRAAIGELFEKLKRLSKKIPIYYFSGTYDLRFCPIGFRHEYFENIIQFNRPFERVLHTYQLNVTNKGLIDRYKTEIKEVLIDEIRLAKERGTCVLFFLNSESTLTELAEKLKKADYKADVYSSSVNNAKNLPASVKHLFDTSTISNCGADIILSTSGLEAGINVNDDVTIVSVPDSEGRLVQRFGRARNAGRYVLIHGVGDENRYVDDNGKRVTVSANQSGYESGISFNDFHFDKCLFSNADHKAMCDRYAQYASQSRQINHCGDVIKALGRKGYKVIEGESEEYDSNLLATPDSYRKLSKSKICGAIYQACVMDSGPVAADVDLDSVLSIHRSEIIDLLVDEDNELPRSVVTVLVSRAIKTISQIQGLCRIKKNPIEVFRTLNADAINMLRAVEWSQNLADGIDALLDAIHADMAEETFNNEQIAKDAEFFWESLLHERKSEHWAWFSDGVAKTRIKLYKHIAGIARDEVDRHKAYVKKEKSWWKDKLETASGKAKYSQFKKAASNAGIDIEQIHEQTGLNRSQLISKYTLSEFINEFIKCNESDEINWGV